MTSCKRGKFGNNADIEESIEKVEDSKYTCLLITLENVTRQSVFRKIDTVGRELPTLLKLFSHNSSEGHISFWCCKSAN